MSNGTCTRTIVAIGLCFGATSAQSDVPKSIRCDFTESAVKTWDDGRLEAGQGRLSLIYDSIDIEKGAARLIGNAGASDVLLRATPEGLHFIELTPSGNFTVTTAFFADKQPAAHSRHMNLSSGPVVSQYHGHCRRY